MPLKNSQDQNHADRLSAQGGEKLTRPTVYWVANKRGAEAEVNVLSDKTAGKDGNDAQVCQVTPLPSWRSCWVPDLVSASPANQMNREHSLKLGRLAQVAAPAPRVQYALTGARAGPLAGAGGHEGPLEEREARRFVSGRVTGFSSPATAAERPGTRGKENASSPISPSYMGDSADDLGWERRISGAIVPPLRACEAELTNVPDLEGTYAGRRDATWESQTVAVAEARKESENLPVVWNTVKPLREKSKAKETTDHSALYQEVRRTGKGPKGNEGLVMSKTANHDAWKAGREPEAEASFATRLTLNSSRVWDPGGVVEGN
jgi:hypothetical protein